MSWAPHIDCPSLRRSVWRNFSYSTAPLARSCPPPLLALNNWDLVFAFTNIILHFSARIRSYSEYIIICHAWEIMGVAVILFVIIIMWIFIVWVPLLFQNSVVAWTLWLLQLYISFDLLVSRGSLQKHWVSILSVWAPTAESSSCRWHSRYWTTNACASLCGAYCLLLAL
jgi:hypothetical protein